MSGAATKKVLEREAESYGHADYVRLAGISVAHLYHLGDGLRRTLAWMRATRGV